MTRSRGCTRSRRRPSGSASAGRRRTTWPVSTRRPVVARGSRSSGSAIACGFLAGPCLNWPKSAGSSPCPSSPLTPIAGGGRSVGRSGCGVQSVPRRERPGGRARRRLGRRAGPLARLVGVAARLTSSCWCRRTEVVVLEIVVRFAPDLVGRRVPGWAAGHRSISTHDVSQTGGGSIRSIVCTRSIDRSKEATLPTPVLSAQATR